MIARLIKTKYRPELKPEWSISDSLEYFSAFIDSVKLLFDEVLDSEENELEEDDDVDELKSVVFIGSKLLTSKDLSLLLEKLSFDLLESWLHPLLPRTLFACK